MSPHMTHYTPTCSFPPTLSLTFPPPPPTLLHSHFFLHSTFSSHPLPFPPYTLIAPLGLGLYSLYKRVEALGGDCGVMGRSDGHPGSAFWFSFPYRPGTFLNNYTPLLVIQTPHLIATYYLCNTHHLTATYLLSLNQYEIITSNMKSCESSYDKLMCYNLSTL